MRRRSNWRWSLDPRDPDYEDPPDSLDDDPDQPEPNEYAADDPRGDGPYHYQPPCEP